MDIASLFLVFLSSKMKLISDLTWLHVSYHLFMTSFCRPSSLNLHKQKNLLEREAEFRSEMLTHGVRFTILQLFQRERLDKCDLDESGFSSLTLLSQNKANMLSLGNLFSWCPTTWNILILLNPADCFQRRWKCQQPYLFFSCKLCFCLD